MDRVRNQEMELNTKKPSSSTKDSFEMVREMDKEY